MIALTVQFFNEVDMTCRCRAEWTSFSWHRSMNLMKHKAWLDTWLPEIHYSFEHLPFLNHHCKSKKLDRIKHLNLETGNISIYLYLRKPDLWETRRFLLKHPKWITKHSRGIKQCFSRSNWSCKIYKIQK